ERVRQRLAVRIEGERGGDAGVERALADELQRMQVRHLVAPNLALHDVRKVALHGLSRHAFAKERVVSLAVTDEGERERIALVAGACMRKGMQLAFPALPPGPYR